MSALPKVFEPPKVSDWFREDGSTYRFACQQVG